LVVGCDAPDTGSHDVTSEKRALTAVLFSPYVATATGSTAQAVAIGDLNGDGRNDVAVTTTGSSDPTNDNMLHVFLQAADGTLQPRVRYALGRRPQSIDIGDVNGDGRADVVVGNFDSSTIGVLLQNGSGTLDPMVSYATVNSLSVKIGDFNSDGRMDVVGINWGARGDGVDVFLQTAAGTLAPPVTYHENHGGYDEVDVGDVNGDGRTDIVVMSGQLYSAPNVGVLPQNADGTMGAPVYYSVGANITTQGVGVGDVNGDGLSDIVVSYGGNRPGSFIARFLQNAQQTLDPAVSYASYDIPSPVVLADVDEDGRKDVLVAHSGWLRLGVYRQTSTGDLGAEELYPIGNASIFQPQGLAVGDINGDGLPDVVVADSNNGLVKLLHVDDVPPSVAITAPSGGISYPNVPIAITWTASDNAALAGFDLSASVDGGATYAPIAGCTGLPATTLTCTWTPSATAAGAHLRVTAHDKAGNSASAESVIDVVAPTLTVTAPGAGVAWVGSSLAITWTDNLPPSATVLVELSRDGGGSFATLAAAAPNTGSFAWTVTGPDTAQALVRLTATGPTTASGLGGAFAIVTPVLAVGSPVSGASWTIGTSNAITWTTNLDPSAAVRIDLSRDGGGSFETLASAAPNTGSFVWTATGPATAAALVRVTASGAASATGSSATFAIVSATMAVTAPAAGASWTVGSTVSIAWTTNEPASDTVRVELSRDGGSSYTSLAGAAPNSGTFSWTVSGATTTSAIVRVSSNTTTASASSGKFSIVAGKVKVTAPNTSVTWSVGTTHAITWTHDAGATATFKIEVSRNGGGTWSLITAAAPASGPASGSYNWTVTSPHTNSARIRVTWTANTAATDTSDVNFHIN
jgi:hypothetical protein